MWALDRLFDSLASWLTLEIAQRIVDLPIDSKVRKRLELLRVKANRGALLPEERAEYEELVEGIDLLSILKAKSRVILDEHRR